MVKPGSSFAGDLASVDCAIRKVHARKVRIQKTERSFAWENIFNKETITHRCLQRARFAIKESPAGGVLVRCELRRARLGLDSGAHNDLLIHDF